MSPSKTGTATKSNRSPSVAESRSPTAGKPFSAPATSRRFEKSLPKAIVGSLEATTKPDAFVTTMRASLDLL